MPERVKQQLGVTNVQSYKQSNEVEDMRPAYNIKKTMP